MMPNKCYLLFAGFKNYIYDKLTPIYLRDLNPFSVEYYVKVLR